mmetsp:Transcript_12965/g.38255  ORF Transcript_12965/g.38255 Transcript_12965/m.38255 type:complete len:338 (+) Transcript_12965:292-1305(+)
MRPTPSRPVLHVPGARSVPTRVAWSAGMRPSPRSSHTSSGKSRGFSGWTCCGWRWSEARRRERRSDTSPRCWRSTARRTQARPSSWRRRGRATGRWRGFLRARAATSRTASRSGPASSPAPPGSRSYASQRGGGTARAPSTGSGASARAGGRTRSSTCAGASGRAPTTSPPPRAACRTARSLQETWRAGWAGWRACCATRRAVRRGGAPLGTGQVPTALTTPQLQRPVRHLLPVYSRLHVDGLADLVASTRRRPHGLALLHRRLGPARRVLQAVDLWRPSRGGGRRACGRRGQPRSVEAVALDRPRRPLCPRGDAAGAAGDRGGGRERRRARRRERV